MGSSARSAGCRGATSPGDGLYRPRNPRGSPLWQCARRHAGELRESGRIGRPVERQIIERFIACGDPHQGFARIYCDACRHEFLLAFSCKNRGVCLSCNTRRMVATAAHLTDHVIPRLPVRRLLISCLPDRPVMADSGRCLDSPTRAPNPVTCGLTSRCAKVPRRAFTAASFPSSLFQSRAPPYAVCIRVLSDARRSSGSRSHRY